MPWITSVKVCKYLHQHHICCFCEQVKVQSTCKNLIAPVASQVQQDDPSLSRWTLSQDLVGRKWEFSWLARNLEPARFEKASDSCLMVWTPERMMSYRAVAYLRLKGKTCCRSTGDLSRGRAVLERLLKLQIGMTQLDWPIKHLQQAIDELIRILLCRGQIDFIRQTPRSCSVTLTISYEVPDVLSPFANVRPASDPVDNAHSLNVLPQIHASPILFQSATQIFIEELFRRLRSGKAISCKDQYITERHDLRKVINGKTSSGSLQSKSFHWSASHISDVLLYHWSRRPAVILDCLLLLPHFNEALTTVSKSMPKHVCSICWTRVIGLALAHASSYRARLIKMLLLVWLNNHRGQMQLQQSHACCTSRTHLCLKTAWLLAAGLQTTICAGVHLLYETRLRHVPAIAGARTYGRRHLTDRYGPLCCLCTPGAICNDGFPAAWGTIAAYNVAGS